MLIKIKTKDVNLVIPIPNFLIDNRLTTLLIVKVCEDRDLPIKLDPNQLQALLREVSHMRRNYGRFNLVEVNTAKGEHIQIVV